MTILVSTTSNDQEKMLASRLIQRSYIKLVASSLCEKVQMAEGAGLTAYFVRYKRMNVPLSTITEGTEPSESSFTLDTQTVTLDQWGDIIYVSDKSQLTTKHPLIEQCVKLLADNAARVMDREVQLVLLANTNVQYFDGSVTTRDTLTSAMRINDTVLQKARITLVNDGAPARGGPSGDAKAQEASGSVNQGSAYVAVCGPEVISDIMRPSASMGSFASVAMYANQKALYNSEVGTWLGFRWVETNFIPRFVLFGNTTLASTFAVGAGCGLTGLTIANPASGGTISNATDYMKVTRKDLLRGFEEAISIEHTITPAAGASQSLTFANTGTLYAFNVYLGTVTGILYLAAENILPGTTATVSTIPTSGTAAPTNINSSDTSLTTVHVVYIFAEEAVNWVGFYNAQSYITADQSTVGNVLRLKRGIGFKFFGKAMVRDSTRLLRIELAAQQ